MGRNVRAEESRAEMVLGRGVPEPLGGPELYIYLPTRLRDRAIFIGTMGQVQNAMGRTLFVFAFKHGADTFFSISSHWAGTFFRVTSPVGRTLFCL